MHETTDGRFRKSNRTEGEAQLYQTPSFCLCARDKNRPSTPARDFLNEDVFLHSHPIKCFERTVLVTQAGADGRLLEGFCEVLRVSLGFLAAAQRVLGGARKSADSETCARRRIAWSVLDRYGPALALNFGRLLAAMCSSFIVWAS
jgi:hypothetical protein